MADIEPISDQYLESLQTPESWADALLSHGTGVLVALFSDQTDLTIPNPKLSTQHIPTYTGGLQMISLIDNCDIPLPQLGSIQGALSEQTDQRYYSKSYLVNKPSFPRDRSFLTFSDSISSLPPGYMAVQYEQPMDKVANPSYDDRSGVTIRELFVLPTKLGKKLIQLTLKSPEHIEKVMQAMLPGLTNDRKRPIVKEIELIEGSDMGAVLRGAKVLPPLSTRRTLEFPQPVGEVEPLPQLLPHARQILTSLLSSSPDLAHIESSSLYEDGVDGRDLAVFLGPAGFEYASQPLTTNQAYYQRASRNNPQQFEIVCIQADLRIAEDTLPFGRLSINIGDEKLLSPGSLRIDFRRLGDQFVLEYIISKGNFQQSTGSHAFMGNMRSLPTTIGELPPVLKQLSKQLNDNSANQLLVHGLRQVLATMALTS